MTDEEYKEAQLKAERAHNILNVISSMGENQNNPAGCNFDAYDPVQWAAYVRWSRLLLPVIKERQRREEERRKELIRKAEEQRRKLFGRIT